MQVAHTCNPNYLGSWDLEDCGPGPAQANSSPDPISKITKAKMHWRCGWSGRVPALQLQIPEFKPQFHQGEKKKKNSRVKQEPTSILTLMLSQYRWVSQGVGFLVVNRMPPFEKGTTFNITTGPAAQAGSSSERKTAPGSFGAAWQVSSCPR
jgi:hypothetical protein